MNEERQTILLPSGRNVTLRPAKVRDLLQAHRATGFTNEPMTIAMALVAEVIELDGKPVIYEELLELSAEDGLILQARVMEGGTPANFPEAPGRSPHTISARQQ